MEEKTLESVDEAVVSETPAEDQAPVTPATPAKPKKKIWENWFVLCVLAYVFMLGGEIIGSMVVNVPVGMIAGFRAGKSGVTPEEMLQEGFSLADYLPDWVVTMTMYLVFIGIWIMFMILILCIKGYKPVAKGLGTKAKGNTIAKFMIGFLIGFAMNGACILAAHLNGDIKLYFDSFRPISFVFILFCVFVQSSAEELVCRGFLYQMICKNYKPWVAIVVNSCFFGALHLMNPGVSVWAIVDIIVTGVLFSFMVYYMDSIWAAMAAHTSWNFCQNIVFGLLNSGQATPYSVFKLDAASARNSFAYNVDFGVESTPLAIGIQVVVAIVLFVWGYKCKKKPTNVWAEEQNA